MRPRRSPLPSPLPLLAALAALPAAARANGRFPNAQQVLVGPGTSSRTIVLRVTFGLVVSRDGGRNFNWYCEDVMYEPYVLSMNYDPPVELTQYGTIVFGFNHGVHAVTDGCSSTGQDDLSEREVTDLAATADGSTVYAIDGTPASPSRLLRAPANTLRFAPVGAPIDNVRLATVDVAPGDPRRLYLSGLDALNRPVLLRSDDGGARVTALTPAGDLGDALFVSGVDPTDANVVYLRSVRGLGSALLRTADGGARVETVARTDDEMLGFAISDDGATVWYGSGGGGLFRSDDRGRSFQRVSDLPVFCLKQHAGTLWACTDWQRRGYALGRSMDRGATFESALRWEDLPGPPDCPDGTPAARTCTDRWMGFQRQLLFPDVVPDAGPPDAGPRDAATRDASTTITPPRQGCDCNLARQGRDAPPTWAFVTLAGFLGFARRRRGR